MVYGGQRKLEVSQLLFADDKLLLQNLGGYVTEEN